MEHPPFRLEDFTDPTDRDRALDTQRGRSSLPLGDSFAWSYFRLVNQVVAVTWAEFQTWHLWMIGAALGMDRIEASEEDQVFASEFFEASSRPPSLDRKG